MQFQQRRKKYVPDLREMQSLAERNYAAAIGLLPAQYEVGQTRQVSMHDSLTFELKVLTDAPYTTDIQVEQQQSRALLQTRFVMRLYHDMQLAEIISSQGLERFAASYEQPNPQMHQRDERRQINHFLADWLKLCFQRGRWHDVSIATHHSGLHFQVKR